MPTDSGANAVRELHAIRNALEEQTKIMKSSVKREVSRAGEAATTPESLVYVPVTLDWASPALNGMARIVNDQGRIKIEVYLDLAETARVLELLKLLEIDSLQISAM